MKFDLYEWKSFASLLKKGYSFRDSLSMCGVKNEALLNQLEQGAAIEDVLLMNGTSRYYQHLQFFLKISPLPDAINSALRLCEFEKNLWRKLSQKCAYPLFIFLFAFVMLYLFANTIIPQMIASLEMEKQMAGMQIMIQGVRMVTYFSALLLCAMLISLIILKNRFDLRLLFFRRCSRYLPFLSQYISYQLSGYLIELIHSGLSTKQCFLYLKQAREDTMLQYCANQMQMRLEQGDDLMHVIEGEEMLCDNFKNTCRIGIACSQMEAACTAFMEQQEQRWFRDLKRISIIVQCGAYSFVGILVIAVYRVMLMPLEMLNEM